MAKYDGVVMFITYGICEKDIDQALISITMYDGIVTLIRCDICEKY